MTEKISTYREFWPYYLQEHSNPICRRLHYVGSTAALIFLVIFLITKAPVIIPVALLCGYGPAWAGHFLIEKNRPATFTYPIWSLISDFRMYFLWMTGHLNKELNQTNATYDQLCNKGEHSNGSKYS